MLTKNSFLIGVLTTMYFVASCIYPELFSIENLAYAMAAPCGCQSLDSDLTGDICEDGDPGLEDCIFIKEECKVQNVPDKDSCGTITADITLQPGENFIVLSRYDKKKSKLDGSKSEDSNRHIWTYEVFIPYLDESSICFVGALTSKNYEALSLVTDAQENTLVYRNTTFAYTYTSEVGTNDAGDPGWILTATSSQSHIPCLYSGAIV